MEDLTEKFENQHVSDPPSAPGHPIPSVAGGKAGCAPESYRRAVAEMAYGFWEARGRPNGSPETDWFKAEEELKPLGSADLAFESGDLRSMNSGKL